MAYVAAAPPASVAAAGMPGGGVLSPSDPSRSAGAKLFLLGALAAVVVHNALNYAATLPVVRYFVRRWVAFCVVAVGRWQRRWCGVTLAGCGC